MPGNIGPLELGIVLVIALVVFGPKRLPELGRSLGRGIREFKGSISGESDESPAQVEAHIEEAKAAHSTGAPAPTTTTHTPA